MSEFEAASEPTTSASRRDVLKLSGASALGAATFFAAASAVDAQVAGAVTTATTHFPHAVSVTIAGKKSPGTVRLSQRQSLALVTSTDATGRAVTTRVAPGLVTVGITREWSGDKTFSTWFDQAQAGVDQPKTVVLKVTGRRGSTISQLTMQDAVVLAWHGPTFDASTPNAHAVEKLVIQCEHWKFA